MVEQNKSIRLAFTKENSNVIDIKSREKLGVPVVDSDPIIEGSITTFKRRIFRRLIKSDPSSKPKNFTPTLAK